MKERKTNPRLIRLIEELKRVAREHDAAIWRDIAERLEKPRRNYAAVNLSRINRYSREHDTIVVPGKVLSAGTLQKSVTIAALGFSKKAHDKISTVGKGISIEELMRENPEGTGVKIIV